MTDYIERDSALRIIIQKQKELCPLGTYGKKYVDGYDREKFDDWQEIIDGIESVPAADAIEALESELDRLRRERDQAVEELHRNTDAVPVVRCKDCKHEISTADIRARTGSYWCNYKLQPCDADDFCSYGERKESNE